MVENCTECTESGKNFKNLISNQDMGQIIKPKKPKEPKEAVQIDFWSPKYYLNEFFFKYVIVAVDRFSRWPSAMVCANNKFELKP